MNQEKQTAKKCPKCNNTFLILIRTQNMKICSDCDTIIPWYLEKDQEPLIKAQR